MTEEKRRFTRQNLKAFVDGVIQRTRNGPRAIWKEVNGLEVTYKDSPADSQGSQKLLKAQPETLVGIYDNRCRADWLFNDLKLN